MPGKQPNVITIKGTGAYARFLDRLARAAGVEGTSALVERAIAEMADRHDLRPPRRIGPRGRPRKKLSKKEEKRG